MDKILRTKTYLSSHIGMSVRASASQTTNTCVGKRQSIVKMYAAENSCNQNFALSPLNQFKYEIRFKVKIVDSS